MKYDKIVGDLSLSVVGVRIKYNDKNRIKVQKHLEEICEFQKDMTVVAKSVFEIIKKHHIILKLFLDEKECNLFFSFFFSSLFFSFLFFSFLFFFLKIKIIYFLKKDGSYEQACFVDDYEWFFYSLHHLLEEEAIFLFFFNLIPF